MCKGRDQTDHGPWNAGSYGHPLRMSERRSFGQPVESPADREKFSGIAQFERARTALTLSQSMLITV
jgi:hypothetical protein